MDRYLSGNASHRQPSQYIEEKLRQENISLKKHSTAFAQVNVLLPLSSKMGKWQLIIIWQQVTFHFKKRS